ncbi:uncharacterized protein At4g18257-like [Mangifera indica]|uniref:uncharacterized protein At4g18257-like n=1 Tax=Mangifera indica TaxID=29780 RepID=UPI001CFA53CA|nr:uncharacterized protein At4g18257-like [Mangifera indica]
MTEEQERKKRVVAESLEWLTESSIMPKKQRSIEGLGPSSILELKPQLYKSQEESKKSKELIGPDVEFHRAKKKITSRDSFSSKNSGVEARVLEDKLELKAVKDGSASYAALERKAELYEKLVEGELSDKEDKEKYCVDFFRKGMEQETGQPPQADDVSVTVAAQVEATENDAASMLFDIKFVAPGRTTGTMDKNEHKQFVRSKVYTVGRTRERQFGKNIWQETD